VRQNERVERALAALRGPDGPCRAGNDLTLIGYSQGAYVGERMAALFPNRYPKVVLLGAPTTPSPSFLRRAGGAVLISGEHDAAYRMKDGARALANAGVPALYLEMPGAHHGEMRDAERIMGEAFSWLSAHAR
jgi:pimeloyl-ACP methyl ester carboxylesterase